MNKENSDKLRRNDCKTGPIPTKKIINKLGIKNTYGIFIKSLHRISICIKQTNISNPPIAKNLNDYVNIAIDLANDKKKNIQLKETLKQAAKIHLFNDLKAVKEFEEFFKVSCNSP